MTGYTDVFGTNTVPPSKQSFAAYTVSGTTQFYWATNHTGSDPVIASIVELTSGTDATVKLPPANQISVGEDVLFRNIGSGVITVQDYDGNTLGTMAPSNAVYVYARANTTEAGVWGWVAYGVGVSAVDAGALQGFGTKAIGSALGQEHAHESFAENKSITALDRAKLVEYIGGGTHTVSLPITTSVGAGFFFMLRNGGTGTLTVDAHGSQLIDDQLMIQFQPTESAIIICTGSEWVTVGQGKSTSYTFSQLVKDLSSEGGETVTLSSAEASQELLIFTGNPTDDVTIVFPNIVKVYYIYNALSTNHDVILKTSGGTPNTLGQNSRTIVFCDGTDVLSALTVVVTSSQQFIDGAPNAPSITFSSDPGTGFYKSTNGVGVSVGGTRVSEFTDVGLAQPASIELVSINTTAVAYKTYVLTNSVTLTLPNSPQIGDWVSIVNRSETTSCVIGRNGSNIMGLAENMTLDIPNARAKLTYVDVSQGWVITNE